MKLNTYLSNAMKMKVKCLNAFNTRKLVNQFKHKIFFFSAELFLHISKRVWVSIYASTVSNISFELTLGKNSQINYSVKRQLDPMVRSLKIPPSGSNLIDPRVGSQI